MMQLFVVCGNSKRVSNIMGLEKAFAGRPWKFLRNVQNSLHFDKG